MAVEPASRQQRRLLEAKCEKAGGADKLLVARVNDRTMLSVKGSGVYVELTDVETIQLSDVLIRLAGKAELDPA